MGRRDFRDLFRQMESDMERFAEESFVGFFEVASGFNRFWQPAADIHETDAGVVIKMELAGVATENVQVSLVGNGRQLLVSGVRTEERDERDERTACHQLEIYFGPFERTFPIPAHMDVERDGITATLRDGFLTITLPRRAAHVMETRHIPITTDAA